ncbi:MAG: hypothetical protein H0T52_14625, partial [Lautropia sp.]|nr:hypothetical protein [Lautropia sp.]
MVRVGGPGWLARQLTATALAGVLAAAFPQVQAQSVAQGLQTPVQATRCLAIGDDRERLACFDRAHGRTSADG